MLSTITQEDTYELETIAKDTDKPVQGLGFRVLGLGMGLWKGL